MISYNRSAWLKKLDEECPFQLTLPGRPSTLALRFVHRSASRKLLTAVRELPP